jgi:hypothetical protein
MPKPNPHTLALMNARSQRTLVEFLHLDLNVAFAVLASVRTMAVQGLHDCAHMIQKVRGALKSVRRLQGRVEDPNARQAIQNRANELDAELKMLAGH